MDIIKETCMTTPTLEDRVELNDNVFELTETYMELLEKHVDTASLHQMQVQVPSY